ncbi:MAG: indole-3-glycerol phosphate synthase TrpC [Clostridium sp.]
MILDRIVNKKIKSVNERKKLIPQEKLYKKALEMVSNNEENKFKDALKKEGLSVIGEFKKASPSKGIIVQDFNLKVINEYYSELGVNAFSILTEEDFFMGKDEYLKEVRVNSDKPIIRKDFIVDLYQIYESKVLGANAVLLMVSVLKNRLKEFYDEVKKLKLEALVEVHNKEELDIALNCGCEIIGINNRDLKTFVTTIDTTKELIEFIPKDKVIVSESGIKTIEDLRNIRELGVDAVLIGEMFMRQIGNDDFIKEYKEFRKNEN